MARDQPGVLVVAAADAVGDVKVDGLAAIKVRRRLREAAPWNDGEQRRGQAALDHPHLASPGVSGVRTSLSCNDISARCREREPHACGTGSGDCAHARNRVKTPDHRQFRTFGAPIGFNRAARSGSTGAQDGKHDRRPGHGPQPARSPGDGEEASEGDRWAKKRTFVRALEGTYSHLYKTLVDEKRVYSAGDVPWKGGPQMFGKSVISPQATQIIQSIESHIEAYAPKTGGQKHGHLEQRGVLRAQGPRLRHPRRQEEFRGRPAT